MVPAMTLPFLSSIVTLSLFSFCRKRTSRMMRRAARGAGVAQAALRRLEEASLS